MDLQSNKLLVTTYRNAYLYDYRRLSAPPIEIPLPYLGQREAITYLTKDPEVAFVSRERAGDNKVADIFRLESIPLNEHLGP